MRCNSVYRRQINDFQFEGHEKSRLELGLHEYSKRPWRDQAAPPAQRAAPSSARSARSARQTQAKNHTRMTGRHAPPVFPPVFSAQPPAKPRFPSRRQKDIPLCKRSRPLRFPARALADEAYAPPSRSRFSRVMAVGMGSRASSSGAAPRRSDSFGSDSALKRNAVICQILCVNT